MRHGQNNNFRFYINYLSFRLRGDFLPNSYSSKIYLSDGEEALLIRDDK